MSTKKRYAHEWRESWEKVDTIRNAMRKYPNAEWYVLRCSLACSN
jgi:mannan polymerase II complex MNN10 subunit